jgi:hypothetical protein
MRIERVNGRLPCHDRAVLHECVLCRQDKGMESAWPDTEESLVMSSWPSMFRIEMEHFRPQRASLHSCPPSNPTRHCSDLWMLHAAAKTI